MLLASNTSVEISGDNVFARRRYIKTAAAPSPVKAIAPPVAPVAVLASSEKPELLAELKLLSGKLVLLVVEYEVRASILGVAIVVGKTKVAVVVVNAPTTAELDRREETKATLLLEEAASIDNFVTTGVDVVEKDEINGADVIEVLLTEDEAMLDDLSETLLDNSTAELLIEVALDKVLVGLTGTMLKDGS